MINLKELVANRYIDIAITAEVGNYIYECLRNQKICHVNVKPKNLDAALNEGIDVSSTYIHGFDNVAGYLYNEGIAVLDLIVNAKDLKLTKLGYRDTSANDKRWHAFDFDKNKWYVY